MCFMRDQATNKNINHNDNKLKEIQREKKEAYHNKVPPIEVEYQIGDSVMIKDQMTKVKPREKIVVVQPDHSDTHAIIQKQDKKFMTRQHKIPKHQLIKLPRMAAMKARQRISETAHMFALEIQDKNVPLHAFNTGDYEEDEEGDIYFTYRLNNIDDEEDKSSHVTVSENSTSLDDISDDDWYMEEDVDDGMMDQLNLITDRNNPLNRTQKLDAIIRDASQFLSEHPRPPT